MTRWLGASAMAVVLAICAPARAQVVEMHGGDVQWEPLALAVPAAKAAKIGGGSTDSMYSNLATFRNTSIAQGGATLQVFNTITRVMADDLNLAGTPPYSVNGFRMVITNLNAVDVSASMLVRFWLPDGPGGGPGTLIAAFTYNPITFTAGVVGTIKTSTKFVLETSSIWAGVGFDNNGGTTGATAAQLDGLALGAFSPPAIGTSADQYFITTAAGSFASDNPAGTLGNFGGAPPADFGWDIITAQDVDLSIIVTDGVTTAFPGGNVVYTIIASNAGPDNVFGARVVDTFPTSLTCTWTCAGSPGNTCAASGAGDINDSTVALAAGGSVTYTAACAVSAAVTGTLANTATVFAPGTAVESALLDNTATDTDTITSVTVPGAPTIAIAAAGDAQAAVAFTPPASNGGSTITSYTATSSPGGFTASAASSPIVVAGLTNGTAYTFTVTGTNAVGTGPPSAPSNSVTPAAVPGPPTIGTATAGDSQATVTFTAPASSGGSPITSYTVTSSPSGITASAATSPITVMGLTNGTAYTFTVTATNTIGTGIASAPSNSVTPATVPGAPASALAAAGNAQAIVAFAPPASNGGATITSYTVTSSPGGITASGAGSPVLVGGLVNGTPYTFTVTATNAVGTGPPSAPSNTVTPAAVPGPPTIGIALPGNAQARITFTPPASSGGSPIAAYTVTSSPGGITASGPGSPITVTGLTNGTAYTFTVTATNAIGTGLASAPSNRVTPATVPGAPTIGTATAGNAQATVAFTPPASDGGSRITSYIVTSSPGAITAIGTASPITVTGLTNGTAYTFTVTAANSTGEGPASAPSNSVTPAAVPGAPTIGTATAGIGQATVTFTPPASNGGSTITAYTATSSPGGITASGAASPITVTGLTNGGTYTFTVTATNAVGTGPASAASNSITLLAVPGAPTIVAANASNGRAIVSFMPPASNGGSPITSYTATCGAFSAAGAASPLIVTSLTNGTSYSCSVTATNAVGTGPPSAAASVTPTAVARSYIAPSATGSGTIIAVFTGGGAACTFTSSRFIPVTGDPASPPPIAAIAFPHGLFDFTLGSCTPGSTVTFSILYPAALAPGTQYWKYGPEPGTPAPHWYILPAAIAGSTVTFSITDGAQGDDDLAANGTIVDQGGPGSPAVSGSPAPIPTLSQWAMLLLSLLLLGFAMPGLRRRR
ncbi:MAG TPA: IPTL-CTERM sorting domain-containing protein [Usitatibacter sp.]|nr:IPTL-CTERM sorting domain-containing protein [Usitatibacter sp.]